MTARGEGVAWEGRRAYQVDKAGRQALHARARRHRRRSRYHAVQSHTRQRRTAIAEVARDVALGAREGDAVHPHVDALQVIVAQHNVRHLGTLHQTALPGRVGSTPPSLLPRSALVLMCGVLPLLALMLCPALLPRCDTGRMARRTATPTTTALLRHCQLAAHGVGHVNACSAASNRQRERGVGREEGPVG